MAVRDDIGLIATLLKRLRKQRLPRLLAMEDKLDGGECLTDSELMYLLSVIKDSKKVIPLFSRYPEFQEPQIKLFVLYEQITRQALINEKARQSPDGNLQSDSIFERKW